MRDQILTTRQATHGDFMDTARVAQGLKRSMMQEGRYHLLPHRQREALDMIATKIARVISGNNKNHDHWADIAGYAKLGQEACDE